MIIAARAALIGAPTLPYDAEVEYLEGATGTLINTGLIIQTAYTIRFRIQLPTSGAYAATYQSYINESSATFRVIRDNNASNVVRVYHGSAASGGGTRLGTGGNNRILEGWTTPGAGLINGVSFALPAPIASEAPAQLRLFTAGAGRLYYLAVDNQCDYIPVRVGSGANAVGYVYDRVSGELLGNAGTGAFVIGPDK